METQEKTRKVLREIRQDGVATLICMPFTADTDDFVSYCTIGKDFKDATEAERFYQDGRRMDLSKFLEGSDLPQEQHAQLFHTRNFGHPLGYSMFLLGRVEKFEQYLGVPLKIVEGSNRYVPSVENRQIPKERIEF